MSSTDDFSLVYSFLIAFRKYNLLSLDRLFARLPRNG